MIFDMTWHDIIWYNIIWYDMRLYDVIWYDICQVMSCLVIGFYVILFNVIWRHWNSSWYDMIWYDMIWFDLMIQYIIHSLGRSETVPNRTSHSRLSFLLMIFLFLLSAARHWGTTFSSLTCHRLQTAVWGLEVRGYRRGRSHSEIDRQTDRQIGR